jgi:NifB/MoaA-like Fe-S oxidoreductase
MATQIRRLPKALDLPRKITLITAVLAQDVVREALVNPLNRIKGMDADLVVAVNQFFGHGITVSGLLTGQDIAQALKGHADGDVVYLPQNVLNDDDLFLDDMTLHTLSDQVGVPVRIFPDSVRDVLGL